MEIDTNSEFERLDDYPPFEELSEEEKGLYWSALEGMAEAVGGIKENREQHEEIDIEEPELDVCVEKVRTAVALSEVLDEIAAWRRFGIMLEMEVETQLPDVEFEFVDPRTKGENDE